ncbi:glycosyltransferase family 4 protein [Prochlorococcus marinus]|uniref:Glycosyl transferase family 1 domain-containing protein n=1 Tax=Prochlorococcus marinus XMU1408 TaxID=2213228 RepID=A0A318QY72_PROMR|nr:glycosyltransferase family 4 protein [Prochlorococcus marinus]PYE01084.1 hypothetical protein DNJ73_06525 [Prochlorococcus marinus XMU1408]
MKLIIHFICSPDPRIGYGVCALNFKKELELILPNNLFQVIVSDPRDNVKFSKTCEQLNLNRNKFNFINIHLTHGLDRQLLEIELPGYKVIYTMFETEVLPLGVKEILNEYDLVLTPSKWGAEILCSEIAQEKVEVVPLGVDPIIFHSWNSKLPMKEGDPFIFVAVGKYEARKSYKEIIEAFELSFSKDSNYRLLLKLDNLFLSNALEQASELIKSDRRHQIEIVKSEPAGSYLKVELMAQFYRSANCFLFPSKGEGWGLPLIEAISCGIPYIATNYSGQTEYLKYCNQLYSDLKFKKELIEDKLFLKYNKYKEDIIVKWAKPDIKDLASKMILIVDNWKLVKEQALLNAEIIHNNFSWRSSSEKLINVILKKLI